MHSNIKVGIIGYGNVGKQLHAMLLETGFKDSGIYLFADDIAAEESKRVFGFNSYKEGKFNELHFIPALGYLSKSKRLSVLNELLESGRQVFSFVHPTCFVSKTAIIGKGVILYSMCNIDQGAVIGDGAILLNSCVVAHDTSIGKCSYLSPGVCLSGKVTIGELCFIGSASVVANDVSVGSNSTIGVGTCVTKNITENSFVIGNPMVYKKNIRLY